MRSFQALTVALHPSRSLAVALLAAHALAIAAIWLAALPLAWHVTLKAAVAASLAMSMRQAGWFGFRRSACALAIAAPGDAADPDAIDVTLRDRSVRQGTIAAGSFVSPWFSVIHFKTVPSRWRFARTLLVMRDSTDAESYRALRVRVRWGRAAAV